MDAFLRSKYLNKLYHHLGGGAWLMSLAELMVDAEFHDVSTGAGAWTVSQFSSCSCNFTILLFCWVRLR